MEPGQLDKLVTIQTPTYTTTDAGTASGWAAISGPTDGKVYAAILPQGGRETQFAQQANAEVTTIIRIRYEDAVTPTCKITYGSREWQIVAVLGDERQEAMDLHCKEVI